MAMIIGSAPSSAIRHVAASHELRPEPVISGAKTGKLVSITLASSIATGFLAGQPHHEEAHGDSVIEMRGDGAAAASDLAVPAAHDQVVADDRVGDAGLREARPPPPARRSLSFTRSSCRPFIRVSPLAKAAATASMGYSSIIEGARAAGTSTPFSAEWRTRRSPTSSPPSMRRSRISMDAAHLDERGDQPGAQRVQHHALEHDVRAGRDQRRDQREGRRGRIGRHDDRRRPQLRPAGQRDAAASRLPASPAPRPRNRRASSRCGRAWPRSRSRWSRPAR